MTDTAMEIVRNMSAGAKTFDAPEIKRWLKRPEKAAATTVWAAVGQEWEGKGDKYLEDCGVAGPRDDKKQGTGHHGYHYACDAEAFEKLWDTSLKLVELKG